MILSKNSNVKDLIELFNDGSIKYRDVMNLFGVSRELIKDRLNTLGIEYDNKAKKMIGEAGGDVLEISLSELFQRKRRKKSLNENKPVSQLSNNTVSKPTIKPENQQTIKLLKKVTYEIEEYLHDELKIMAIKEKRKVSEIVGDAIKKYLKEME